MHTLLPPYFKSIIYIELNHPNFFLRSANLLVSNERDQNVSNRNKWMKRKMKKHLAYDIYTTEGRYNGGPLTVIWEDCSQFTFSHKNLDQTGDVVKIHWKTYYYIRVLPCQNNPQTYTLAIDWLTPMQYYDMYLHFNMCKYVLLSVVLLW